MLTVFWLVNKQYRWILLLLSSYFFYGFWEVSYLPLILISTSIDYFLSRYLTSSDDQSKRKFGLYGSIVLNLGLLFIFKYYNFFQDSVGWISSQFGMSYSYDKSSLLLPVGISFYTFQTLSYSIDVYRKTIKPEKHFGKFALFVAFFPQLVAGPIERAKDLLPQLNKLDNIPSIRQIKEGLILITYGLFTKVVVADNCGLLVDNYYRNSEIWNGGTMLFATYLFAIQIYADFSGYSNMAIGIAKLFGVKLNTNFNTPFFSDSLGGFWKNWHISLTNWMRDYVYIPLGGSKKGKVRTYINLFLTFLVSGLWHGAALTYVVWGAMNGIYMVFERIIRWNKWKVPKWIYPIRVLIIFHVLVVMWVMFRSESIDQFGEVISKIAQLNFYDFYFICGDNKFTPGVFAAIFFVLLELMMPFKPASHLLDKPVVIRYSIYLLLVVSIILIGNSSATPFIYFQF